MILGKQKARYCDGKAAGFSLIELAIVVTIIGLFIASALQTYRIYQQESARGTNFDRKKTIEVALGKFMAVHGRLPCPADPSLAVGTANAGRENCRPNNVAYPTLACNASNSLCRINGARYAYPEGTTVVLGTVPTKTGEDRVLRGGIPYASLGLAPRDGYDAWGSMFAYAVTEMLASSYFVSQGNTTQNCIQVCGVTSLGSTTLNLNANPTGSGRVFTDVLFASYGTPTGSCATGFTVNNACHGSKSVDETRKGYVGRASRNWNFGTGTYDNACGSTSKRLAVILRACEATASVSYNEANGVIGIKGWSKENSVDTNVSKMLGGTSMANAWTMAFVSYGPDRKGGWNARGRQPIACAGQGRDVLNCTMTSATFINESNRSFAPGAQFYDDAFVSASPIRESDKWHYSMINAIRNKDGSQVGIGTSEPSEALDVDGAIRMGKAFMVDYCNRSKGECFKAATIGGAGISCEGSWMTGISNNGPNCEKKVDVTEIVAGVGSCPTGSFLFGFCANGSRMCKRPGDADPVCN